MASQLYLTLNNFDPHFKVVKSQAPVWFLSCVYENLSSIYVEFKTHKFDASKVYNDPYCQGLATEILNLMPTISGRQHCDDYSWLFRDEGWLNYFAAKELTKSSIFQLHNKWDELPKSALANVANLRTTGLLLPDLMTSLVASGNPDYEGAVHLLKTFNYQEVQALMWRMAESTLPERKRKQAAGMQAVKKDKDFEKNKQWQADTSLAIAHRMSKKFGFEEGPTIV